MGHTTKICAENLPSKEIFIPRCIVCCTRSAHKGQLYRTPVFTLKYLSVEQRSALCHALLQKAFDNGILFFEKLDFVTEIRITGWYMKIYHRELYSWGFDYEENICTLRRNNVIFYTIQKLHVLTILNC